jgi:DNA transposition AAA+ family ATPase
MTRQLSDDEVNAARAEVRGWMVDDEKRVRKMASSGQFYETQTVKRIAEVLDYCAEQCAIGVITADFGVGKTEAVKAWRRATAGKVESVVFEFDDFSAHNVVDFVRVMAR